MKNLLLAVMLFAMIGIVEAKQSEPIKTNESIQKMVRPAEYCVNGVTYYVVREYRTGPGTQGYGYGFMAPKIDRRTLDFVRCHGATLILEEN